MKSRVQDQQQLQDDVDQNQSSSIDEIIKSTEDISVKEENSDLDRVSLKQMMSDENNFLIQLIEMNNQAVIKLNQNSQKEALVLLIRAEKILEFAANCGKSIDRNLIICVLYNRACAYQGMWLLEKCSKYLDGVIYNLEQSLLEEDQKQKSQRLSKSIYRDKDQEKQHLSFKIKKQTFLVKAYMQLNAILSQLGQHKESLKGAKKCIDHLRRVFQISYEYCKELNSDTKSDQLSGSNSTISGNQQSTPSQQQLTNQNKVQQKYRSANSFQVKKAQQMNKQQQFQYQQNISNSKQTTAYPENQNDSVTIGKQSKGNLVIKEEIQFSKQLYDFAFDVLQKLAFIPSIEEQLQNESNTNGALKETKRFLYYWKNNPENNEKQLRQELHVPLKTLENESRGLLGVQNAKDWIETFNIGTIMHMSGINYEDFTYFVDFMYEISKRNILEKVIYLSISYFTIATEMRFLQVDELKNVDPEDIFNSQGYKQSEIFHLKSIQTVCQYITVKSPFINHLITSYHKHYNQTLETINEEHSIASQSMVQINENGRNYDLVINQNQNQFRGNEDAEHQKDIQFFSDPNDLTEEDLRQIYGKDDGDDLVFHQIDDLNDYCRNQEQEVIIQEAKKINKKGKSSLNIFDTNKKKQQEKKSAEKLMFQPLNHNQISKSKIENKKDTSPTNLNLKQQKKEEITQKLSLQLNFLKDFDQEQQNQLESNTILSSKNTPRGQISNQETRKSHSNIFEITKENKSRPKSGNSNSQNQENKKNSNARPFGSAKQNTNEYNNCFISPKNQQKSSLDKKSQIKLLTKKQQGIIQQQENFSQGKGNYLERSLGKVEEVSQQFLLQQQNENNGSLHQKQINKYFANVKQNKKLKSKVSNNNTYDRENSISKNENNLNLNGSQLEERTNQFSQVVGSGGFQQILENNLLGAQINSKSFVNGGSNQKDLNDKFLIQELKNQLQKQNVNKMITNFIHKLDKNQQKQVSSQIQQNNKKLSQSPQQNYQKRSIMQTKKEQIIQILQNHKLHQINKLRNNNGNNQQNNVNQNLEQNNSVNHGLQQQNQRIQQQQQNQQQNQKKETSQESSHQIITHVNNFIQPQNSKLLNIQNNIIQSLNFDQFVQNQLGQIKQISPRDNSQKKFGSQTNRNF